MTLESYHGENVGSRNSITLGTCSVCTAKDYVRNGYTKIGFSYAIYGKKRRSRWDVVAVTMVMSKNL